MEKLKLDKLLLTMQEQIFEAEKIIAKVSREIQAVRIEESRPPEVRIIPFKGYY